MSSTEHLAGEEPILVELAAAGYAVRSLSDLRESGRRYRDAVPVLLRWLPRVSDPRVKEQVVRALSVPWAKPAASKPMIEEFRKTDASMDPTGMGLRWAIGNAVEVLANDAIFDEMAAVAQNRLYGKSRQMIVLGLSKSKRPEAVRILLGLIDDPDVDGHAVMALGRLKASSARSFLEGKLEDQRAWVRAEARKALAKLPQ